MYKLLSFKEEAREKLFKGVSLLADAVTTTLGPKGRNVAIQRQWGMPIVVHDGVTVAREVGCKDELRAIGMNLVREAAQKTNEEAGDGTTTATLLAYEIVKEGLKLVKEGMNPMVLRTQIYAILPDLLAELKKLSSEVKDKEQIARVAYISSADLKVGELVAEAIEKVGSDGLVTVEEGKGMETEVEYTDGMEFKKGYISPYFVTNPKRMEAVIENPFIVILNKQISMAKEIIPILETIATKVSKDILIIAMSVSGDALATLVHNKMKGVINAVAVPAPGHGDDKVHYLEDIAVLTGAKVWSDEKPINIHLDKDWLGKAERVIVTKDTTVIIRGGGDKKAIQERIKGLRQQKKDAETDFVKEKIEERLAKLTTGVGVIKVGAKTEIDMREKLERVKDAIGAATAAKEEGVVAGGGTVFLQMRKVLKKANEGQKLLWSVLESPARKLMANSGESNEAINDYISHLSKLGGNLGYEVESGMIKDLKKEGIIDPTKVVRLALENAVGVGTSILTTDCLIAIKIEKEDKQRARP